jgi:D-lactate dehydrogenase (cytochrome)
MINLSQMNRVLNFYEKDLQIQVEPAMGWMELNEFLAEHGLFFPVDPGPGAGIGGMVNTSCSGTNAFRYGTMREWVVNLEVVLADGRVINTA